MIAKIEGSSRLKISKLAQHKNSSEQKIRSILSRRSENVDASNDESKNNLQTLTEEEISSLLRELNVYQFEFEMRNNVLKDSYITLYDERETFADLYASAPVAYLILDHLGTIEEVNQTGVNLLGHSKSTLQKKRFQSFLSPNDLEKFHYFSQRMHDSNEKINIEVKLIVGSQPNLYTRIEGFVTSESVSSNVKYYITLTDITESRQALIQLKETKERLEMTLEASSTGIWNIEHPSNQMTLDDCSYKILELEPWQFHGNMMDFFLLIHPEDQKRVRFSYIHSIKNSLEIDIEFRIVLSSGRIKCVSTKGREIKITDEYKFFAGIMMDVTEKKRREDQSESLKLKQQREILSATMLAQENERFEISRALHDSVCQVLYGIRLNLQSIPYYKDNKETFKDVNHLLDQAIKETREISYELTPSVLRDFGFTAGVKEMASRLSTSDFLIKTRMSQAIDQTDSSVQLYAFRIIQELINNCIKHAHATRADIVIRKHKEIITIVVSDNGKGFNTELSQALKKGSGLRGIKNQLFLLNGKIAFSKSSKGTTITVTFNKNVDLQSNNYHN